MGHACTVLWKILTPFVKHVVNILNQSGGMKVMNFMLSDVVACVMSLKSLNVVVGDNRQSDRDFMPRLKRRQDNSGF